MARELLWVSLAALSLGCLVAEPPEYLEPQQTPPILDLARANPPVSAWLIKSQDERIVKFSIPVRSEDREPLFAAMHQNYKPKNDAEPTWVSMVQIEPSGFKNTRREITLDLPLDRLKPGCSVLTLWVTHHSNFDFKTGAPKPPQDLKAPRDTAMAVWWALIRASSEDPIDMSECKAIKQENP